MQELLWGLLATFVDRPRIETSPAKWTRMAEILTKKSLKRELPGNIVGNEEAARDFVRDTLLAMGEDAALDYIEYIYRYSPYIFDLDEDSFGVEMGRFAASLNELFIENDLPYRFIGGEILPV